LIKVLTVIGARPQFIKASALSRSISKREGIKECLVHTGQHFDANMSDIFFEQMKIPKPDYNLGINSMKHGAMTGTMMIEIEKVVDRENPDVLLVYGDTNSTLAGALVASKLHIPVAHVEAGLRSFNNLMPEEINRILTDRISRYLFCPTDEAVNNLRQEGFDNFHSKVFRTGDVMYDSALHFSNSENAGAVLQDLGISGDFALCTIHRAENTDDLEKLSAIVEQLNQIHKELQVVLPLHPRTKAVIEKHGLNLNVKTIAPVGYLEMLSLLKESALVITDSGGLQKEAYFFKKYCLTVRDQTEWVELVESNVNELVDPLNGGLYTAFTEALNAKHEFPTSLYGNGDASDKIAEILIKESL